MNQANKSFEVSELEFDVYSSLGLDIKRIIEAEVIYNEMPIKNWVNNMISGSETKNIEFESSISLIDLQLRVNNFVLPDTSFVNKMSLKGTFAYETMIVNIMDKIPNNTILAVNILLHLKIINNNLIHKFRIFE